MQYAFFPLDIINSYTLGFKLILNCVTEAGVLHIFVNYSTLLIFNEQIVLGPGAVRFSPIPKKTETLINSGQLAKRHFVNK